MLGSGFRIQGLMHLGFSVFRVSGLVGQGLGFRVECLQTSGFRGFSVFGV